MFKVLCEAFNTNKEMDKMLSEMHDKAFHDWFSDEDTSTYNAYQDAYKKSLSFKIKQLFDKISDFYYAIRHHIFHIWYWIPVMWGDRSWDYYYLYRLMYFKIKEMRRCICKGTRKNSKNVYHRMFVCECLLKRLMEDDYILWYKNTMFKTMSYAEYENKLRSADKELLFKYLSKYIEGWWD